MKIISSNLIENIECRKVTEKEAIEITRSQNEKIHFIKQNKGCGLAAPQFGDFRKYFFIGEEVFFNPSYTEKKKGKIKSVEGCLSYPNKNFTIKRNKFIIAKFDVLVDGKFIRMDRYLKGLQAVVFQHECDHCGNDGLSKTIAMK